MQQTHALSIVIKALDQATAPIRALGQRIDRLSAPARQTAKAISGIGGAARFGELTSSIGKAGGAIKDVAGEASALAGKLALLGGGLAFGFKKGFVDVASQFEDFQTVLTTLYEGDAERGAKAMEWVSDFAAKTPYELAQVNEAFVKLQSYGMDPTNGLLKTLGDTAAGMGKPIMSAVEAIADAVNGENERLKEFGIRAEAVGDKFVYSYDKNGKTIRKAVDKNNRQLIQSTLSHIWNDKYGGAMENLSHTWSGMLSNVSDWWTRFAKLIMDSGAFSWLKDKLQGVLSTLDEMGNSGALKALAEDIGKRLVTALETMWSVGQKVVQWAIWFGGVLSDLASLMGGWDNLLLAVATVMAGPLIAALAGAWVAIAQLGWALATTPIGWFLGAIALLAGAAFLIYRNWGAISEFFTNLWAKIVADFEEAIDWIMSRIIGFADSVVGVVQKIGSAMSSPLQFIRGVIGSDAKDPTGTGDGGNGPGLGSKPGFFGAGTGAAGTDMRFSRAEAKTEVVIKGENLPRGLDVSVPRSTADDTTVDLGYAMAGV